MHAIGIDLGATGAVVAAARGAREAAVVTVARKERSTPSFVSFSGRKVLLGIEAQRQTGANPAGTFRLRPGLVPQPGAVEGPSQYDLACHVAGGLKAAAQKAEKRLRSGTLVTVVAVPSRADDAMRAVYRDAVRSAGFDVRGTVGAAQAAATAYGLDRVPRAKVLVVILGGLSLEATVLDVTDGRMEVVGGGAVHPVGGEHWTAAMADHVAEVFRQEHDLDLRGEPLSWQRLFEACEAAKPEFANRDEVHIAIPYVARVGRTPKHVDVVLRRDRFDAMTAHLVDACRAGIGSALEQARITPADVDEVIVTGGGSRLLAVADRIRADIPRPAAPGPHPQESVALGAALWAWTAR